MFFAAETDHKEDTRFKEAEKQFVLLAGSSESAKTSACLLPSGCFIRDIAVSAVGPEEDACFLGETPSSGSARIQL